jgi:8-oxo-dGTP pyrophosphatase MutT (NUDIX family)
MPGDDGQMIRAAGGVLWRSPGRGTTEVALVHRPEYGDWSLPKGKIRRGEHPLVTACREVAEETGVHAAAGRRLDIEHYDTALGPKAVEYWAMQGPDAPITATPEVDRLAWLPLPDARQRLDYQRDTYAIDALEVLAAGAAGPSVLLVRNGRAVPVRRWAGSGGDRPLDFKGQEQAEALRLVLPAFGPSRLLSAPDARFAGTMRPLGADLWADRRNRAGSRRRRVRHTSPPRPDQDPGTCGRQRSRGRVRTWSGDPAPARRPRRRRRAGSGGMSGQEGPSLGVVLYWRAARCGGLLSGSRKPATLMEAPPRSTGSHARWEDAVNPLARPWSTVVATAVSRGHPTARARPARL